ncbi:MAG: hypothetical protein IJ190_10445 [Prevotella sp.]|nr:hypothetical protein [Prevotella sp.]
MLPEEAEYSASMNDIRVSVKRIGKDSLMVSAQGVRQPKQKILVAADLSSRSEVKDTSKMRAEGSPAEFYRTRDYQPRGQPSGKMTIESITICVIAILLIALIAYEYNQRSKKDKDG